MQVINVVGVKTGIATEPIKKYGRKGNKHRYVSIMTHNASFDVALESDEHRDSLVLGAKLLIQDEAVNVYKRGIPITKYSQKDPTTGKIPAPKKIVMKLVEQTGRNLLAFDDGPEDKAAVELAVYENERHSSTWGSTYPGHLLPTDRSKYTDETGYKAFKVDELATLTPYKGYSWDGKWKVDHNYAQCDKDGWTYASDMWVLSKLYRDKATTKDKTGCYTRRKKWVRVMRFTPMPIFDMHSIKQGVEPYKTFLNLPYGTDKRSLMTFCTYDLQWELQANGAETKREIEANMGKLIKYEFKYALSHGVMVKHPCFYTKEPLENAIQLTCIENLGKPEQEGKAFDFAQNAPSQLYVTWMRPSVVAMEVYENERYQPGAGGWGSTYPGHLLPTDRAKVSPRCVAPSLSLLSPPSSPPPHSPPPRPPL